MKFLYNFVPLCVFTMTVTSIPIARRDVNEALVPQFGLSSGVNPTGASLPVYEYFGPLTGLLMHL
jgi:hypothetical protein